MLNVNEIKYVRACFDQTTSPPTLCISNGLSPRGAHVLFSGPAADAKVIEALGLPRWRKGEQQTSPKRASPGEVRGSQKNTHTAT